MTFTFMGDLKKHGLDDIKLKAAFASGDEEAVNREFAAFVATCEAKAARDPIFVAWYHDFCKDQELLLRWDDTLQDDR